MMLLMEIVMRMVKTVGDDNNGDDDDEMVMI